MANIKDFAVGLVVTPPSPATTGTSLTLRTGEGATMPTPPFYVTAGPPGELTTVGTSEKLLVTGVSGDTLTIVRAQTPTTAKSIAANWIVANALYVEDVVSYVAQPSAPTNTKMLWYDTDDSGDDITGNNADTVDGYHASAAPTANYIPVLNSSAKLPHDIVTVPATTDANGWKVVTKADGKKMYTKSGTISGISLPAGISFANGNLTSTPIGGITGASLWSTNYVVTDSLLLDNGSRHVVPHTIISNDTGTVLNYGIINLWTGGAWSGNLKYNIRIEEV